MDTRHWKAEGRRRCRRRAAALIEFVMVLPLLALLLLGIMEVALVSYVRLSMLHAGREAARYLAVREATAAEAEAIARGRLHVALVYTVTITEPTEPGDRDVSVTIATPFAQAAGGDGLGLFGAGNLEVTVTMRREGTS